MLPRCPTLDSAMPSCTIDDMRVIVKDENEAAVERVRRRAGDKSPTETVNRLIAEADRGPCPVLRGDGRACGAPIGPGDAACLGCIFAGPPKRTRKGAK
jgi:hypothetical protein